MTLIEWVAEQQGKHICQCGCGEPIDIKRWHHSAGIPRFRAGHHMKGVIPTWLDGHRRLPVNRRTPKPVETRLCECGCGELVSGKNSRGQLIRFRPGHQSRRASHPLPPRLVGSESPRWKQPGTTRQVASRDGLSYVQVKCEDGKWRYQHRVLMEAHLGRKLERYEHVHHVNGDTADNRIENLQVLRDTEHSKLHCVFPNAPRRILVDGELVEAPPN